jgi:hypothetical protein
MEETKQESENLKNFKKLVSDEISPAMKDFVKQETLEEAERMYSEEEVLELLLNCPYEFEDNIKEWFEQFKKK